MILTNDKEIHAEISSITLSLYDFRALLFPAQFGAIEHSLGQFRATRHFIAPYKAIKQFPTPYKTLDISKWSYLKLIHTNKQVPSPNNLMNIWPCQTTQTCLWHLKLKPQPQSYTVLDQMPVLSNLVNRQRSLLFCKVSPNLCQKTTSVRISSYWYHYHVQNCQMQPR